MDGTEFIQKFFDKIAWVNLIWTWERECYSDTDFIVEFENNEKRDVVIGWCITEKDPDYSFNGSPKQAIEFFDSYDCWDNFEESDIKDMVLEKANSECSDNPPYELKPQDFINCTKIECYGLCYWKNDRLISVWGFDDVKRIYRKE